MPKTRKGGQGAAPQPPAPPQIDDTQDDSTPANRPTPNDLWQEAKKNGIIDVRDHGYTVADLQAMNDDDMHDMLLAIAHQDLPDYLMDNQQQRLTYALNMDDKPVVETDATFTKNSRGQKVIYNAQNDARLTGYTLSADDIHDYIRYGDTTLVQNGVYGNGLYYSDKRGGSASYGTRQTRARLNPATARVVTSSQLKSEYDAWTKTHPRSQKALGYMKSHNNNYGTNTYSQFATIRGYNVIATPVGGGETYYTVLNRNALIISDTTKKSGSGAW